MRRRTFAATLLASFAAGSLVRTASGASGTRSADTAGAAALPPELLQADVALLRSVYEALHPGLYRFWSRAALAAGFERLRIAFSYPRSRAEVFVELAAFLAEIRCAHTYPNYFNQPDATAAELFGGRNRVPFYFEWVGGRMIVTRVFAATSVLRPGSEVLSLGGVPATDIHRRMLTVARSDGHNDGARLADASVSGRARYETFDVYLPLLFPQACSGGRFALESNPPGLTRVDAIEVRALTADERWTGVRAERGESPWRLEWPAPTVAQLRMPTWAMYDSDWDWRAYLAEVFTDLRRRNTRVLVLDLRGNRGGSDAVGDWLLARLVTAPAPRPQRTAIVRYRKVPEEMRPHLSTWDKSFYDWGARARPRSDGDFDLLPETTEDGALAPAEPSFRGRVVVLVDEHNSSATFLFAEAVRRLAIGQLVGRPTGGNQRGINGGAYFFLTLPGSQVEVDVPLIGQYPLAPAPDAGLLPDRLVPVTREDIAAGVDCDVLEVLRGA